MADISLTIKKHVLKNASDYGRANPGAVAGKVIAECPQAKADMKGTMGAINAEIARVGALSKEQIEAEMKGFEYAEKKKEEKRALDIPGAVMGKVVTRFPPEPSGYPHIGHAKAAFLDKEIAVQYDGKMILRFDDTNPEKESAEFVDAIKDGLAWLGIPYEKKVTFTSDHIPAIYRLVEQLIKKGKAYVCTCTQDKISQGREKMLPCPCRSLPAEESMMRWKRMLDSGPGGYKEGQAVVRFVGDLQSQNTVMRDPSLARIIVAPHFRQGTRYRVWPNYDLAVVFMDSNEGITHPLRTKEYELRDELYFRLVEEFGFRKPDLIEISRLQIKNAPISKRLLKPLVEGKKVMGWDDPRLPTLKGLARRGLLPAALKEFVLSFGLSKVESEPTWEALLALNRKLLDPVAPHYFFVWDPMKLEVKGLEKQTVQLKRHPKQEMGSRDVVASPHLYIARMDSASIKSGESFRLKDLCNVKLVKKGQSLHGDIMPDDMVEKKIQWVSVDGAIACEVLVPKDLLGQDGEYDVNSLESKKGFCESACRFLDVGTVVQFERFGFCRLDKKEIDKLTFIYTC